MFNGTRRPEGHAGHRRRHRPADHPSAPSSRYGDRGGSLKMPVGAAGRRRSSTSGGSTARTSPGRRPIASTLTNIQATNAGSYTVVVTNTYGAATSSVATLTVNPLFTTVFADNFDTNSSANWTVNKSYHRYPRDFCL